MEFDRGNGRRKRREERVGVESGEESGKYGPKLSVKAFCRKVQSRLAYGLVIDCSLDSDTTSSIPAFIV